jgi:hypothetical protein
MPITPDGFLDWATRMDGVPDKVHSQPNSAEWITCHSVVGEESEFEDGIPNRFLSTERDASGRYTEAAAASCMFILRKNGTLIQMYPVWASTWTSGGSEANTRSWAIEAEGGLYPDYGEPLTAQQTTTFLRLVREWEAHTGRKAIAGGTLRQHKDVAREFGYRPTACASDRYADAWRLATERAGPADPPIPANVRELIDAAVSAAFRPLFIALFTGGFTTAQGEPLPVPPEFTRWLDGYLAPAPAP